MRIPLLGITVDVSACGEFCGETYRPEGICDSFRLQSVALIHPSGRPTALVPLPATIPSSASERQQAPQAGKSRRIIAHRRWSAARRPSGARGRAAYIALARALEVVPPTFP